MEFRFTLRDNGMRAAFQLLHMVLEVYILSVVTVNSFIVVCCFYKFLVVLHYNICYVKFFILFMMCSIVSG